MSLVRCVELKLPPHVPGSFADQEEEEDNTGAIAPGLAPKMSAAKAAKSAAEKDARIAVSLERFFVALSCSGKLPRHRSSPQKLHDEYRY